MAHRGDADEFYARVGGHSTFVQLVDAFFVGVEADPALRAIYPDDLEGSKDRLRWFLEQFWGGPAIYSRMRGAPALKMRHMPFKCTPLMTDRWLLAMHRAISTLDLPLADEGALRDYMDRAARYLINAGD